MAGIIVADTIQSGGSFIRLNSASQTVATINAAGIYANTGNLLIAANGTIGVATITNTAITGTITQAQIGTNVAATGPAFFAWRSSSQSISGGVYTKINFQSEVFDIGSCYDSTTNYRFTPNVAGYYWFGFSSDISAPNNRYTGYLYKNGSLYMAGPNMVGNGANSQAAAFYGIAYANGTTDYFEIYIQGNNSTTVDGSAYVSYFQGYLVRAA